MLDVFWAQVILDSKVGSNKECLVITNKSYLISDEGSLLVVGSGAALDTTFVVLSKLLCEEHKSLKILGWIVGLVVFVDKVDWFFECWDVFKFFSWLSTWLLVVVLMCLCKELFPTKEMFGWALDTFLGIKVMNY